MKVLKCEIILRKNVNTLNRRRTIGASASNTIREIKTFKKRVMIGKKNKTFFYFGPKMYTRCNSAENKNNPL